MAETVVVGGGLAGSMAALELARVGRAPVLLERSAGPRHVVCGEFLSREALHYLARHDIDVEALGAVRITRVRLAWKHHVVEAPLPFAAASLTRYALDEALLKQARGVGVTVLRECHVTELIREGDAWALSTRDGRTFRCADVFLASGKHDLRGWPRPAGTHAGLVAFKMYFALSAHQRAKLANTVELLLFRGGYAGLQPVENDRANLCLLITAERLREAGSSWSQLLKYLQHESPHLEERLSGATALLEAPLAASHIPYGYIQPGAPQRLWMVGDQAAVIPSFCGDGMSIALHSAALAARHYRCGHTSAAYAQELRRHVGTRLKAATRLSQGIVAFPHIAHLARLSPGLLSRIAYMTRIPDGALVRDQPR